MKITIRGGHVPNVTGCSKYINELTEDRKVKDSVIKYLRMLDYDVLDVTPPDNTQVLNEDLRYGVTKSNNWGADLFVSIHFNKAYDSYDEALGSEVCVYSNFDIAQRVVNALGNLGFKNRGQKVRTNLFELKYTNSKSMIIEVCFVESIVDVALYKQLGYDLIGKAIAEAIVNQKIGSTVENKEEVNRSMYVFSKNWYLYKYPDVANSVYKDDPYIHYAKYGKSEARLPIPPIPPEYNEGEYLELNLDVAQAVARGEYTSGVEHYLMYGFNENRKINK